MLSSRVKGFVEDNIHLIETRLWKEVFSSWYNSSSGPIKDHENFREFYNILVESEIVSCYEDTEKERIEVLHRAIDDVVGYFLRRSEKSLHIANIVGNIYSYLGFRETEILKMIVDHVSEKYSYDPKTRRFQLS